MKHQKYLYKSEEQLLFFEFVSDGPKGLIKKVVQYTKTNTDNVYNIGFGDFDETTKGINDLSITNNGDSAKVLATVASTLYSFTEKYPQAWIFATGSTTVRTRLYRMGITNNLSEISKDFIIFGYNSEEIWEKFVIGNNYDAFLLTKKENDIDL